ncbi:MAG: hypothetical protein Q7K43_03465 [Candidatus Woesearchaeota archaeon]|nr:hypothetical protein [Candidatus Woesearchaeota archaeon]
MMESNYKKPILALGLVVLLLGSVLLSGCLNQQQEGATAPAGSYGNETVSEDLAAAADVSDLPNDDLNDSIEALNELK